MAEDTDRVVRLLVGQKTLAFSLKQFEENPEGALGLLATISLADVCAAVSLWNFYESALRQVRAGADPVRASEFLREFANRRVFRGIAREVAQAIARDPEIGTRFTEVREAHLPSLYLVLARGVDVVVKEMAESFELGAHPFVRKMSKLFEADVPEQEDGPTP